MNKCIYCGKPIILVPSAKERAKKYGGNPSDYTKLFKYHSECLTKKREEGTLSLVHKLNKGINQDAE